MELQIRNLDGSTLCSVLVDASQLVGDIKNSIQAATGVEPRLQQLLCGSTMLTDGSTIQNVIAGLELTMVQADLWSTNVAEDWHRLRKAPEEARNRREVVLAAVHASHGLAIKFAGDDARADPEIMGVAMEYDVKLWRYGSPHIGKHAAFVKQVKAYLDESQADQRDQKLLATWHWEESPELCADLGFMSWAISLNYSSLKHASEEIKCDRELIRSAIVADAGAFQFASAALKRDKDLCKLMIMGTGQHRGLRSDHYKMLPEEMKADRDLSLSAVQGYFGMLEWVPDELKNDRRFALDCAQSSPHVLQHMLAKFTSDREVVATALTAGPTIAQLCSKWDKSIKQYCGPLSYVARELRADREIAELAVANDPGALEHVSDDLKADKEFVTAAVRSSANLRDFEFSIRSIAPTLLKDADFMLQLQRENPRAQLFCDFAPSLRGNPSFVLRLLAIIGDALTCVPGNVKNLLGSLCGKAACDPSVLLEICRFCHHRFFDADTFFRLLGPLREECEREFAGCMVSFQRGNRREVLYALEKLARQQELKQELVAKVEEHFDLPRSKRRMVPQLSVAELQQEFFPEEDLCECHQLEIGDSDDWTKTELTQFLGEHSTGPADVSEALVFDAGGSQRSVDVRSPWKTYVDDLEFPLVLKVTFRQGSKGYGASAAAPSSPLVMPFTP